MNVFILTDEWIDYKGRNILRYFGISENSEPVQIVVNNYKPFFFIKNHTPDFTDGSTPFKISVPHLRRRTKLKSFSKEPLDVIYFNAQRDLLRAADIFKENGITTFEADIDPAKRFLMERGINAQMKISGTAERKDELLTYINPLIKPAEITPAFVCASLDIETGTTTNHLYSIAVHLTGAKGEDKKVFMIGDEQSSSEDILFFKSEPELLNNFLRWFKEKDPDIIIGWHVIGFDLVFLESKFNEHNIPFDIARGGGRVSLRNVKGRGNFASITGRVVIDGPPALRAAFYSFEDFKLETVAQQLLGVGKIISPDQNKTAEIERLFANDKQKLAEYNLQDAVLVSDIFKKTGLIELSVTRSQLSGLLMHKLGMMTAAFDHFYLPKIHKAGYAAPDVKDIQASEHAVGGYVIDPKPGIYDDVVVLDFKSLYPSIILTFKIDPLSRLEADKEPITTPVGYKFSSTNHFLPGFIETLLEKRAAAKKYGDKYLSQAIKILMNSFYGVMGSYGCRFYHHSLPSAITETGQWLLINSKEFLESSGYKVVYGDTDSLFVRLREGEGKKADEFGNKLAENLNSYWQKRLSDEFNVQSFLEIEYEKYYAKFIITPARGSETGAKKRYAGLKISNGKPELEFVGMEFVRSDWTRLAKDFQVELYKRIFAQEEIENWIRTMVADVKAGRFDDRLVYRKRIRKDVGDYKNIPPQVKAAKMLSSSGGTVQYVITKRGPIPIELDYTDIDYHHYIEKQLKPVADSVLALLNTSFDEIVNTKQLNFFEI